MIQPTSPLAHDKHVTNSKLAFQSIISSLFQRVSFRQLNTETYHVTTSIIDGMLDLYSYNEITTFYLNAHTYTNGTEEIVNLNLSDRYIFYFVVIEEVLETENKKFQFSVSFNSSKILRLTINQKVHLIGVSFLKEKFKQLISNQPISELPNDANFWVSQKATLCAKLIDFITNYNTIHFKSLFVHQSSLAFLELLYSSVQDDIILSNYRKQDIDKVKHLVQDTLHKIYLGLPTIATLAEKVNMSPSKFKTIFKHLYKESVHQYFLNKSLEKSKELLLTSECSVSQIAYKVGFCHPAAFSKAFKKRYDISPKQCIQNI